MTTNPKEINNGQIKFEKKIENIPNKAKKLMKTSITFIKLNLLNIFNKIISIIVSTIITAKKYTVFQILSAGAIVSTVTFAALNNKNNQTEIKKDNK